MGDESLSGMNASVQQTYISLDERAEQVYHSILEGSPEFALWITTPKQITFNDEQKMQILFSNALTAEMALKRYEEALSAAARRTGNFSGMDVPRVSKLCYDAIAPKADETVPEPKPRRKSEISAEGHYANTDFEAALAKLTVRGAIDRSEYFRGDYNGRAFAKGMAVIDSLRSKKAIRRALRIVGDNSSGKTTLLMYLATVAIEHGLTPFYLDLVYLADQYDAMAKSPTKPTKEDWAKVNYSPQAQAADLILLDGWEGIMKKGDPKTNQGAQRKALELTNAGLSRGKGVVMAYSGDVASWVKMIEGLKILGTQQPDEHFRHLSARMSRASRAELRYPSVEERPDFIKDAILSLTARCNGQLDEVAAHLDGILGRNADPGTIMANVEDLVDEADDEDCEIDLEFIKAILGDDPILVEVPGQREDAINALVFRTALDAIGLPKSYVTGKGREPTRVRARNMLLAARKAYTGMTTAELVDDLPIGRATVTHSLNSVEEQVGANDLDGFLTHIGATLFAAGYKDVERKPITPGKRDKKQPATQTKPVNAGSGDLGLSGNVSDVKGGSIFRR
ncbi:hypothetical protein HN592_02615 [Candidatus Woesearchaeota archaeon]|jgi:chromosomal replication initiation ATPase DnaA|nr:hypothetical protein [Candidatus Woesearchaeota archaeon]MBT4368104.1 hypothetical protein [Candidatus Woesearchaeota archaeon]MBT4712592.1 hypothetical protein [Candidatus Woesearchaeota archaeon]MBT6639505.1 hypothetical protein [Candidatus Woesearchaeota archaeon]MBT7133677.1 hypothetical protein [Candidatus Woesearchaeota archaeon]